MTSESPFYKIYYFLILLLLIIAGGTFGYMFIEGWSFVDAFYMTIITVSTVGFGEVRELTLYGKLFTTFLIIFSFGIFAYALSSLTLYVIGGEYKKFLKQYKTMKKLKKMDHHIVICGYGRVGAQAAEDLKKHGYDFIVIERDKEITEKEENQDIFFLHGDSTKDDVLEKAYIGRAKGLITCLPNDAENIYVVLAAREINKKLTIVSRASSMNSVSKLKLAGATNVIMPDLIGGAHMASLITQPDVIEFLDMIKIQGGNGCNIESISYEELPDELKGKDLNFINLKKEFGVTVVGIKRQDGSYIINPSLDTIIKEGERIFVLGNMEQIRKMVNKFNLEH